MNKILEYLVNNWYLIVAALSIVACAVIAVLDFFKKPTEEQLKAVREWLLFGVVAAEKALGSGTGKLKLRYVYDMFLEKFPVIAQVLSFDKFSELVDSALEEMKALLSTNENVKAYVGLPEKTED